MNRLGTRLLLAMLSVALVSLLAVPVATSLADRAALATLPEGFRVRLQADLPEPWILRSWLQGRRPALRPPPVATGVGEDATRLRVEVERLVTYVGDARVARREATVAAVALALLVSAVLAWWVSRSIARPIAAVSAASSELASGRFGARVELANRSAQPRETRDLADGFNTMSAAIERYEAERKALVADVAHELRTPLAAMRMRLEALEDGLVPVTPGELALLRRHTDLLARLVDDLRLLSLADAGRLTLERREVELGEWLRGATEALRDVLEQRGLRLEVRAPAEPVRVSLDPQRMTQVLHNLLANAAHHAPEGSDVVVAAEAEADGARITVRDRGPGVPEDEIATIFERFTQGRRRDGRGPAGSGLGLAIVRTLVELHGGRVTAHNLPMAEGGGAVFTVALPR